MRRSHSVCILLLSTTANRGVIWGRLASENLLNPRWELEVQVPITEEEWDELLGLLNRDAAERRGNDL